MISARLLYRGGVSYSFSGQSPQIGLKDVARRAGVSVVTASRALRTPGKVAPETRARVEAAVASLGYVPNLVAGALASARTHTVGILVPTVSSSIFAATVNGLTDALEAEGYAIVLAQSGYDAGREASALAALLGRRPEGVVMVGAPMTAGARAMLENAAGRGAVVVETWDLPAAPIGAVVGFANDAAGAAVASRFASLGRRALAFVGGADMRATARWRGFSGRAAALGLPAPCRLVLPAPAAMAGAVSAYEAAAPGAGLAAADAIFAATDVHAMGLLAALRAAGRRVPEDVAVVGLGDLEMGRYTVPALSTVRIDGAAMGRGAAGIILAALKGRGEGAALPVVDLGFELVLRESG